MCFTSLQVPPPESRQSLSFSLHFPFIHQIGFKSPYICAFPLQYQISLLELQSTVVMASTSTSSNTMEVTSTTAVHAPIVFAIRGKPDTCLMVFGQQFHVSSAILKLYSDFFNTFLDSPDKSDTGGAPNTKFKYNWVTKVDEDGEGWMLTSSDPR